MRDHQLYKPEDFTEEDYQNGNQIACLVIDGGLAICKVCGRGEAELDEPCTKMINE